MAKSTREKENGSAAKTAAAKSSTGKSSGSKPAVKVAAKEKDKDKDRDKANEAAKPIPKPIPKPAVKEMTKEKDKVKTREATPAASPTYKSPFPTSELSEWRQLLMERRSEITTDMDGLVKDAMEAEDGHTTPNHIAERGTDADLQDMSLGMVSEEKEVVWQIDRALRKIDHNRPMPFGLCEFTKQIIPKTRLQLIPWTPLSIEGATHMEQNALTLEDLLLDD